MNNQIIINELQEVINSFQNPKLYSFDINDYNKILEKCVLLKEFAATVFVYDYILLHGINVTDETFNIIDKLHSKTIPEFNNIVLPECNVKKLPSRRRIHKIMKGHNYSKEYNAAQKYLEPSKKILNENQSLKTLHKDKLAKVISNELNIKIKEAKYIITKMKRIKFI